MILSIKYEESHKTAINYISKTRYFRNEHNFLVEILALSNNTN